MNTGRRQREICRERYGDFDTPRLNWAAGLLRERTFY
jgi:hypothetical protein